MAKDILVVEVCFKLVVRSLRDDVTTTRLISLIQVNSSLCTSAKFGGHETYGNGDIDSFINSYMGTLGKKLNSLPRSVILKDF